jgi:tetratricopeptide (TPR) repeat protein
MNRKRGWGIITGVAILTAAARTQAADATSASPAERLFYQGLEELGRHAYERAREDFEASVALAPRGSALRNLATVDWALGLHVEALKQLRAALRSDDLSSEVRESARKDLDAAYAATGHIALHTDPDATVRIDGVVLDGPVLNDPIDVEAGHRVIETRLGDRTGRVEVEAKPGVVVAADVFVAAAASTPATIPVGVPDPASGDSRSSRGLLRPFWTARRAGGTVVAAAGAVSFGLAMVFLEVALQDQGRARAAASGLGPSSCIGDAQPAACAALSNATSAQWQDAHVSQALVGTSAVAVALGAALFFWPEKAPAHGSAIFQPTVGPSFAGAALAGTFR